MAKTTEQRFWEKVERREPDECWPWLAATGRSFKSDYGRFWVDGRLWLPHRYILELMGKPVPPLLTVDHLCRNTLCVNPAHLEIVSGYENTMRGNGPTAKNARKTHCKYGHPYSETNTYEGPGRHRRECRACHRRWSREYVERT